MMARQKLDTVLPLKFNDYKIIPKTAVVLEFRPFKNYPGWNKQQLIQLAAAEIVETDLTFDTNIICVRPTNFSDLFKDGRAYCFKHGLERSTEMFKQWICYEFGLGQG